MRRASAAWLISMPIQMLERMREEWPAGSESRLAFNAALDALRILESRLHLCEQAPAAMVRELSASASRPGVDLRR